jgi:thiol-disulfide isomerase/thioredoxin
MNINAKETDLSIISNMSDIVIIDIFTQSCVLCRPMSIIIDELEMVYKKIQFIKIDVSEGAPKWVIDKNIRSVPTLLFIKNGEVVKVLTGKIDKITIICEINRISSPQ